jgi:hypothetical protein
VDLPDREVNAAYFNKDDLELLAELLQEVIDLPYYMSLHAVHADLLIYFFIEPFDHSVFHFADSFKISEVLL